MAFNVDEFRAANRPWAFVFGSRTFTAKHVSAPQVLRYQDMLKAAGADHRKIERALWWILRIAFPWRPSYWLRGDPVTIIIGLDPAARVSVLNDFFWVLSGAKTVPTPIQRSKNGTHGTTSSTPTLTRSR